MIPSDSTPASRVRAVLDVSRRLADARDRLGDLARARLVELGVGSPAGVDLALRDHLETSVSGPDLERLLGGVGSAPGCGIVLSGNVCVAPVRALALGLATSPRVVVKASRRDPVLAEILAAELDGVALVSSVDALFDALGPGDEVHAYGHDETLGLLGARARHRGLGFVGHGTGFGVALVEEGDDLAAAARALAADLVPFDGGGCLSPRLALVAGGSDRAVAFGEAAFSALEDSARTIPRAPLDDSTRLELARARETFAWLGHVHESGDHFVAVDPAPERIAPAPACRAVTIAAAHRPEDATRLLAPWSRFVTCLGRSSEGPLSARASALAPEARLGPLGRMQRPPLDGPVDRRRGPLPVADQATGTKTRSR